MSTVRRYTLILTVTFLAMGMSKCPAAQLLWSTGFPKAAEIEVIGTTTRHLVIEYVSGFLDANSPQRFVAAPFHLAHAANITEIQALYSDAHPDTGVRTQPTDVSYIVWNRAGLDAPTSRVAEGSFGAYEIGTRYENGDVDFANDFTHSHPVDFMLSAGDYYFTLYSKDTTINWVSGGTQPAALEQDFIWRSRSLPTPGFQQFVYPFPTPLLADSKDVYNPIFSIIGEPVPEPGIAPMLLTVFGAAQLRRRAHSGR